METMIAGFFIILIIYLSHKTEFFESNYIKFHKLFTLGIVMGFAALARIDALLLIFSFLLISILSSIRKREKPCNFLRKWLFIGLGLALIYLPWLFYSFYYTGSLFPISGKAIRYFSLNSGIFSDDTIMLLRQSLKFVIIYFISNNLALIIPVLISFIIILLNWKKVKSVRTIFVQETHTLGLFFLFILLAYTFYFFTPWYYGRYFFPTVIFLIVLLSYLLISLINSISNKLIKNISIAAVFILTLILNLTNEDFGNIILKKGADSNGYMQLGLWAKSNFKDGTVIGSSQTGGLGYFADNLKVINLDGVVNEECYKSLVEHKNMDYIKEKGIEYVIGWDLNINFIKYNSDNFQEDDLLFLYTINDFKTRDLVWKVYKVNYNKLGESPARHL